MKENSTESSQKEKVFEFASSICAKVFVCKNSNFFSKNRQNFSPKGEAMDGRILRIQKQGGFTSNLKSQKC
jgi:hypothetical protein